MPLQYVAITDANRLEKKDQVLKNLYMWPMYTAYTTSSY